MKSALARSRRCAADERGSSSVEFALLMPTLMMLFYASFEATMFQVRQTMLDRGVDMAVRELRLSAGTPFSSATIRRDICARARILPDCTLSLIIEMTAIDGDHYALPADSAPCAESGSSGVTAPPLPGAALDQELMLLRACYAVDPVMPTSTLGLALTESGGRIHIHSASAFVVEPVLGR